MRQLTLLRLSLRIPSSISATEMDSEPFITSRVLKKGKKSENRSDSEAKNPTILTPNGVVQHPARVILQPDLMGQ